MKAWDRNRTQVSSIHIKDITHFHTILAQYKWTFSFYRDSSTYNVYAHTHTCTSLLAAEQAIVFQLNSDIHKHSFPVLQNEFSTALFHDVHVQMNGIFVLNQDLQDTNGKANTIRLVYLHLCLALSHIIFIRIMTSMSKTKSPGSHSMEFQTSEGRIN